MTSAPLRVIHCIHIQRALFVCPVTRLGKSADCFFILFEIWQATVDNQQDSSCELLEIEGSRPDSSIFQSLLSDYRVHISDMSMQDALGFNYVSPPHNTVQPPVTSAATDQDAGDTTSSSNNGRTSSQQTSKSNSKQEPTKASGASGKGGKPKKDTIGSSSEGGGDDDENRKKKDEKLKHDSISKGSKSAERKRLLEEERAAWSLREAELLAASEEDEDTESKSNDATSPKVVLDTGHCQPTSLNATSALPTCHQQAQVDMQLHPLSFQEAQNETLLATPLQSAQNDTLRTPPLQLVEHATSPAPHEASPAQHVTSPAQNASSPAQNAPSSSAQHAVLTAQNSSSPAQYAVSPAQNAPSSSAQHEVLPAQNSSSSAQNASSSVKHTVSPAQNASSSAQHAASPVQDVSSSAQHAASPAQNTTDVFVSTLTSLFPNTRLSSTIVTNNHTSTSEDSGAEVDRNTTPLSLNQNAGNDDARSTASSPGPSTPKPPTRGTSPIIDFNGWESAFGCPLSTPRSSAGEGGNASQHPPTNLPNDENLSTPDPTPAPCTTTSPDQVVATPKKRVVNCGACKRGKKTCPKCVTFSVSASAGLNEVASVSMSTRRRSRNSSTPIESPEAVSTLLNTHTARVSRRHQSPAVIFAAESSDVVLNERITTSVSTGHHSSSPREFSEVNSQQLHTHDTTCPVPCIVQQQQNQPFLSNTIPSNVHHTPFTSMGATTSPILPLFSESNNIAAVN